MEKNSILQIERRRKELLNSKKTFEFIDFGTGFNLQSPFYGSMIETLSECLKINGN